jgi:hypothetical protein
VISETIPVVVCDLRDLFSCSIRFRRPFQGTHFSCVVRPFQSVISENMSVMQAVMLLGCACVLMGGIRADDADNRERVQQIYAKCMSETQAEDKDLEGFRKMQIPDSEKGNKKEEKKIGPE